MSKELNYDNISKLIKTISDDSTRESLERAFEMLTKRVSVLEQNLDAMNEVIQNQLLGNSFSPTEEIIPEERKLVLRDFVYNNMKILQQKVTKKRRIEYMGDYPRFEKISTITGTLQNLTNLMLLMKTQHDEIIGIFVMNDSDKRLKDYEKFLIFIANDKKSEPT